MSLSNAEKIIQQRFETNWTATEIEWQNSEYQPTRGKPFVKMTFIPGSENTVGLQGSTNLYRTVGVVFFGVFLPTDEGTRLAWIYADQIMAIFRGVEDQGIRFRGMEANEVGEASGWFQVNVSIAFEYDESH